MLPVHQSFQDVNEAYRSMQMTKHNFTKWEDTRNGRALVYQSPVIVAHHMPTRRVLFDPVRDANPFFHYMEAIWMLSGGRNVDFPSQFAGNLRNYSDDGVNFHGAYGWRWRNCGVDQIHAVCKMLSDDPNTRRAVISMWDFMKDLGKDSKDLPCNTHIYFRITDNQLHMTVCNRSNDLVWGMLGANIVHFSFLQEYIAHEVGADIGTLYQFTNNLHVYEGWENRFSPDENTWYYEHPSYKRVPFNYRTLPMEEAEAFVSGSLIEPEASSIVLRRNAFPMLESYTAYKEKAWDLALHQAGRIYDDDWRDACVAWILRRRDSGL